MPKSRPWLVPLIISAVGLVASVLFAMNYPAVEGIGDKVRLPVFHGAMTWANLVAFGALALSAVLYLVKGGEEWWARASAYRYVTIVLWLVGSVLGFAAAMNTWDFTGSKTPATELMLADPRLLIQLIISLMGLAVLILPLITESRKVRAAVDVVFVGALWVSLGIATQSEQGLHPDSPVLNSDEIIIKALFFAMVACQMVMAFAAATAVTRALLAKQLRAGEAR